MSPRALRRQIGRLLIGSFSGTTVPPELRSLAREFDLGGVTLFARNVEAPEQVAELAFDLKALGAELPCWVSIDQEGGRVARLRRPFTEWPPMATLGRAENQELADRFARALAVELSAVGVSLDFAPVLDVHTNPANPVIGDRALSDRADVVAQLGVRIVRALQDAGVAACGKHFPGHGDTSTDSHHELPLVEHPPERLREIEFQPFRAAIDAGVATIMTAHVLVPALDEERPATLSRAVVHDILREELRFGGLILSDDLEMRAIADRYTAGEAAVGAIAAGCDALLLCSGDVDRQALVLETLIHAAEGERLAFTRLDEALQRMHRVKTRFLGTAHGEPWPLSPDWRPDPRRIRDAVGRAEHQAVSEEMAAYQ
jgi:beta-N-acetylhexosaminidase